MLAMLIACTPELQSSEQPRRQPHAFMHEPMLDLCMPLGYTNSAYNYVVDNEIQSRAVTAVLHMR